MYTFRVKVEQHVVETVWVEVEATCHTEAFDQVNDEVDNYADCFGDNMPGMTHEVTERFASGLVERVEPVERVDAAR